MWAERLLSESNSLIHVPGQRVAFGASEMKSMLGAAIEKVFGRQDPFVRAKIANFRLIERSAEMTAKLI